jgi:dTDP-4-dehydrorhamnose 3,5-epimerase
MTNLVVTPGPVSGVHVWQHKVFEDLRGKLAKVYVSNSEEFGNLSFRTLEHFFTFSKKNVFRGMHLQSGEHSSNKIVSLVSGSATDFLLDLRVNSSTFGFLQIERLDESIPKSIYIPEGIAHGYISTSNNTIISYRYDVEFCQHCDSGINPSVVSNFFDYGLDELIVSLRDSQLTVELEEVIHNRVHI